MTYLLDTHALVWALTAPEKLSARAREVITDLGNELAVSAASAWELSTKVRLGKWPEADLLLDGFAAHVRRLRAAPLAISIDDSLAAGRLAWVHRDPFDRMLVAQAASRGITIITMDRAIADYAVSTLW
ncbi:twitching motility protein PilT [Nocardioides baekrokdamisoli]|uniref:Twitching motility protein PilT n=1 Tax=Nocardioides baekrokdamisoli TaxID=1804624 RepID=A0A3G9IZD9_9ACTN|nr:type II toxin-antitoxin system VapC family toxin [Nocardioides baekrokdamisoli]BBH16554.1 twitching motility protein PilT [Nocardioides baekrokdamisoli]